jgi:hypothetical protein
MSQARTNYVVDIFVFKGLRRYVAVRFVDISGFVDYCDLIFKRNMVINSININKSTKHLSYQLNSFHN